MNSPFQQSEKSACKSVFYEMPTTRLGRDVILENYVTFEQKHTIRQGQMLIVNSDNAFKFARIWLSLN